MAHLESVAQFSKRIGVTVQHVRRLIKDAESPMPGVTMQGRAYVIDAETAEPWCKQQVRKTRKRSGVPIAPTSKKKRAAKKKRRKAGPASPETNGAAHVPKTLDTHEEIRRLDDMLSAILDTIRESGEISPRVWDIYEKGSKRRQALIAALAAEEERQGRLMRRDDHSQIVRTIALLVKQEIESLPSILPDAVSDALTKDGMTVNDNEQQADGRRVLRCLGAAMEAEIVKFLQRLADIIEQNQHDSTQARTLDDEEADAHDHR